MAPRVVHALVSTVPDDGEPGIVSPNDWNADHTISGLATSTTDKAIVRFSGTTGNQQNSANTIDDTGLLTINSTNAATGSDAPALKILPPVGISQGLNVLMSASGTPTGGHIVTLNRTKIQSDAIVAGSDFVTGSIVEHYFGTSTMTGGREAFAAYAYLTSASGASNGNRNYVGVTGVGTAQAGDGGTGLTTGTAKGAIFGSGFTGVLNNGAVNILNVTGCEFNTAAQTGSSVALKSIAQFVGRNDDAVAGSVVNAMLWLYNQGGGVTWTDGILIDNGSALGTWPISSGGSVLRTAGSGSITNGIDLSNTTFSGSAFKSTGFSISGAGVLTAPSAVFSGSADQSLEIKSSGTSTPDWNLQVITSGGVTGRLRIYDNVNAREIMSFQQDGHIVLEGVTTTGATGTGNLVFASSPTLTTPTIGVATATSVNKVAITAPATSATLTIADGKTLTANQTLTLAGVSGKTLTINNSLTLAGTDSTTMTFPSTSATIARTDSGNTFTGDQVITGNAQVGAAQQVIFNTRTHLLSPADGVLELTNNAGTDFTRISLGGTTASFPAVVRGSNFIYVKLADDSAFTGIAASVFQTTTALITATGASTPSFGTNFIGGTGGPTTAAQNGWVKMFDSTGATIWVPAWK